MVIRPCFALCLALAWAAAPIRGERLGVFRSPLLSHPGSEGESFQNPAAAAGNAGWTLGLGSLGRMSMLYGIAPLPAGSQFAFTRAEWFRGGEKALSLSTRFGRPDTAGGFRFGMNMKWDDQTSLLVFDPGLRYRFRRGGRGDQFAIGAYTFGLLGQTRGMVESGYGSEEPSRVPTEAIVEGDWISPSGFWELSGALGSRNENASAPGFYQYAYFIRHLEAAVRPVPWLKLGGKLAAGGVREYSLEWDWRFGAAVSRLRLRMAGYRDYEGHAYLSAGLQLSLFGNTGRRSP